MSGWELFTWINVIILGGGSLIVFILFLYDLPKLLNQANQSEKNENETLY